MKFPNTAAWYCLKTQPKREKVAAASLNSLPGVRALFPQVRYEKQTARGKSVAMEAMFPNYLFARFTPAEHMRAVGYARGVAYVVHQGEELCPVPERVVNEIANLAEDAVLDLPTLPVQPGETVKIIHGIFEGSSADVLRLIPGTERVKLLLEILGRASEIELSMDTLQRRYAHPLKSEDNPGA
ncbi:MAG: transcription termination/antitermination NusG family protein [Verrucomicrobiota bacterium]